MADNFNPRSPHGERPDHFRDFAEMVQFQPTLPARGATTEHPEVRTKLEISTHAPRTGSDRTGRAGVCDAGHFNPRSPHGERLYVGSHSAAYSAFQPTLPARGATSPSADSRAAGQLISTHAPRTGSDAFRARLRLQPCNFNPRSPHGERRPRAARGAGRRANFNPRSPHGERHNDVFYTAPEGWSFQPTLPARGATPRFSATKSRRRNFNPRSPHGERHYAIHKIVILVCISTHAPRTGSDLHSISVNTPEEHFNPRSPHGERPLQLRIFYRPPHFNPRSPHGERHGTLLLFAAQ